MIDDIYSLREQFESIKNMGWVKSLRKGSTGIGYTFETLLGKMEDSFSIPDYKSIEIKTHRKNSKSYVGLFNYNPCGTSSYELKRIYDKYGYLSTKYNNVKVLNVSVYSNIIKDIGVKYKFSLRVCDDEEKVFLLVFDRLGNLIEKKSYWSFDVIREKLYKKMQYLAYVEASCKYINGCEYFKYTNICFYKLNGFNTFISLLKSGKIRISFLVSDPSDSENCSIVAHGTSFSIKPDNLNLLYTPIY